MWRLNLVKSAFSRNVDWLVEIGEVTLLTTVCVRYSVCFTNQLRKELL